MEIKLRETPIARAYGSSDPVAAVTAGTPTERMSRPVGIAPPVEHEQAERGMVVARSTLIGLCLTAFACGIVTTVALDRHHLRALEGEIHAQAEALAAAQQAAPAVAEAAPKPVAPARQPVVVPLPPEVGTAVTTPAASPVPPPARVAATRAPRPTAARVTGRRRPAPTASPAAAEPADNGPAPAWVDPFAE